MTRFDLAKKVNIAYILESYGYRANKDGFYVCPFHNEKTPSAKIKDNKLKCFGCGNYASTIDLIQQLESISDIQAVNLILSKFNHEERFKSIIEPIKEKQKKQLLNPSYIRENSNKVYKLSDNKYIENYLTKRCIKEMVGELTKFGVTIRHNYYKRTNYIIYDFGDYMIQKALDGSLKRNIGSSNIFIMEYDKNFPYYIVEGIEDCLSLLKVLKKINVICLNSVANKHKLFELLEQKEGYRKSKFIFALDYDNAGIKTGKKIKEYFIKNDIKYDYYRDFYKIAPFIDCIKDINDYIIYLNEITKGGKYVQSN